MKKKTPRDGAHERTVKTPGSRPFRFGVVRGPAHSLTVVGAKKRPAMRLKLSMHLRGRFTVHRRGTVSVARYFR